MGVSACAATGNTEMADAFAPARLSVSGASSTAAHPRIISTESCVRDALVREVGGTRMGKSESESERERERERESTYRETISVTASKRNRRQTEWSVMDYSRRNVKLIAAYDRRVRDAIPPIRPKRDASPNLESNPDNGYANDR